MAAAPEYGADTAEPFSPSVFLDLPPTPRPGGDGEDPAAALPDDLVLPFISRILMEEDMDDEFFYHYPDHPALLQAQETYAQILSDATMDFSSAAAAASSCGSRSAGPRGTPGSGSFTLSPTSTPSHPPMYSSSAAAAASSGGSDYAATGDTDGSGTFTLSPSSSPDIPAFANATWPYDPLELTQLLAAGDASAVSSPGGGGGGEAIEISETNNTTMSAGDSVLFFSGQSRVNMEMLNQAFLKGMEEANKFLPTTTNNLLMATSRQGEKKGIMFQEGANNGRGRKNRHRWDDCLEEETGRKTKLMVPEQEETGEMVGKMVFDGYIMCLNNMENLRIAMDTEAKNKTKKSEQGRESTNGAVDLRTLLIHCAQAVSMDDHRGATELLRQIKKHSSPRGDANQRLAYCFAEGLEARLAGTGSQLYKSLMAKLTSVLEFLKAYQLYLAVTCFKMTAYRFSNMTIGKAIAGKKKLHIVDYGVDYGCQWPNLLAFLAKRKGGPPEVRMTCIELPEPAFRPTTRIDQTGRRLSQFAHQCGLPFKFQSITAKWETVSADDLNIDPDEVLVVNSITNFQNLMDEGIDIHSPSPRDVVLNNIKKMRPDVFILSIVNGSYNAPFFVTRFRESLFYYSAIFDMLDATAPRDNHQRLVVERDLIGRCALNVITCEGSDRVERPETYRQWQGRNRQAGLRQLPLNQDIVKVLSEKVGSQYHKDFVIDIDRQWLLQGWKGRILYAMSTWIADDDATSEL